MLSIYLQLKYTNTFCDNATFDPVSLDNNNDITEPVFYIKLSHIPENSGIVWGMNYFNTSQYYSIK